MESSDSLQVLGMDGTWLHLYPVLGVKNVEGKGETHYIHMEDECKIVWWIQLHSLFNQWTYFREVTCSVLRQVYKPTSSLVFL